MKLKRISNDMNVSVNDLLVMILGWGLVKAECDPEYYKLPRSEDFEEGC